MTLIDSFISELKYKPGDICQFRRQCSELYNFLSEENRKRNLTRIISEKEFWIKHIADSLLLFDFRPKIAESGISVADLGTGAGFPSLVLAMAAPEIEVTAIESSAKKAEFVVKAAEMLSLKNIKVVNMRGREMAAKAEWNSRFDFITARAVADAKKIFREVRRLLKPEGEIVLYKTPEAAVKEIRELRRISTDFNWEISKEYKLPENMGIRCFIYGRRI